jgi:hypothetical protein
MSKTIPLTRGFVALVDDEDYEWLNRWSWYAKGKLPYVYATRQQRIAPGKQSTIRMHRVLLGLGASESHVFVDHANKDTLDNRRSNLRRCTPSQNQGNTTIARGNNRYRGVSFVNRSGGYWVAQMGTPTTHHTRAPFRSPEEAARVYDEMAKRHFGEFATLNFPDEAN